MNYTDLFTAFCLYMTAAEDKRGLLNGCQPHPIIKLLFSPFFTIKTLVALNSLKDCLFVFCFLHIYWSKHTT